MLKDILRAKWQKKDSTAASQKKHTKTASLLANIGVGVGLATAATMPLSAQATEVSPSTASYTFSVDNRYNGTATRKLSKSGNNWTYKVNARVSGVASANQSSTFKINGTTVSPSSASTSYKFLGVGRTHNLSFNPTAKRVSSTYRGKTMNLSAPNGALDDLSLEVQIREDLLNNRFSGTYYMAKKDKVEKTSFKKVGTYNVTVPAGTYQTVRIDRIHNDSGRTSSFWLAPSLNYLPVKISQINDGKKMEMQLTGVQ